MAEKTNVPYDTMSRASTSSSQSIFSKCCCCIPLRIGCFILGYISLVINTYQTWDLIDDTTFIGQITNGFDHIDPELKPIFSSETGTDMPDFEELDKPVWTLVGIILIVMVLANVAWLVINIACLVGLHKKRPGPIRVYVGFATTRLLLALAGFIHLMMHNQTQWDDVVTESITLSLTAYFICVYYIYAVQLEKARGVVLAKSVSVNDVFIYPTKLDKSHLLA